MEEISNLDPSQEPSFAEIFDGKNEKETKIDIIVA
jgi:hypothetical protein